MILKDYLPLRVSREGYIPDRLVFRFYPGTADLCRKECLAKNKTVHYHLSETGTVTALTPISAGATLQGRDPEGQEDGIPPKYRQILILIEGDGTLKEAQKQPLFRLIKGIQREVLRIYGQPFPFRRENLHWEGMLPVEEILEEGVIVSENRLLYRVQTGNYRSRKDAEDSIFRLQQAGIAAYITEVQYP